MCVEDSAELATALPHDHVSVAWRILWSSTPPAPPRAHCVGNRCSPRIRALAQLPCCGPRPAPGAANVGGATAPRGTLSPNCRRCARGIPSRALCTRRLCHRHGALSRAAAGARGSACRGTHRSGNGGVGVVENRRFCSILCLVVNSGVVARIMWALAFPWVALWRSHIRLPSARYSPGTCMVEACVARQHTRILQYGTYTHTDVCAHGMYCALFP